MPDANPDFADAPRWKVSDVILLVLFFLGLLGWFYAWPLVDLIFQEWARYPKAGDAGIGIVIVGFSMLSISIALFLPSIFLCLRARRLPLALRIVALLPPGAGLLVGVALMYRAFGG
jgi:hypothetical protein